MMSVEPFSFSFFKLQIIELPIAEFCQGSFILTDWNMVLAVFNSLNANIVHAFFSIRID